MPADLELVNTRQKVVANNADLCGSGFTNVSLSGASFDDVNLSGATIHNVNLTGVRITDANLTGMTIEGVPVSDLFNAWRAANRAT